MTNFDINALAALANAALAEQKNGHEFLLSDVHNMTRQAYDRYGEDPIIRQFAFVIEQKVSRGGRFDTITQGEMSNVFNELSGLGSTERFRNTLGGLVNAEQYIPTNTNDEFVQKTRLDADISGLDTSDYVDSALVNALDGAFGGSMPEPKVYNDAAATKGAEFVQFELESLGFKARVDVLGGDQSTLVFAAHLDTQKGLVSVAIPLDVSHGKVLLPSTFVADDKLESLTSANLQYFIDKKAYAGDFSTPKSASILKAVGIMTGRDVTASDDDFASTLEHFEERGAAVNLSGPELFTTQQNEAPQQYIDTTPEVEMPKELSHLSQSFEDDILETVSAFGRDAVTAGKLMLSSELRLAGFKNAQVRYGTESKDSVTYLASISTARGPAEIQVPLEMHKAAHGRHVPLAPTSFTCQDHTADFTESNLQQFSVSKMYDGTMVHSAAHSHMSMPELKSEIVRAASANDYNTCETILGTIQARFEDEVYKTAVADYHYLLNLQSSHKNDTPQVCRKEISAGRGSISARCGHHLVTMDKIVVGEDGHCRLKTALERERLNPVEETGAAISTNKLFWT